MRQPISLLVLEVDHFQLIDRVHGVQLADAVLREIARVVCGAVRERDMVARRGGAELLALLPGVPPVAALDTARRIAALVRAQRFPIGGARTMSVSVSIGVASAPEHATTYQALLAAAERARELVRRRGQDGVALALSPAEEPSTPPLDVDRFVGRADQLRTLTRWLEDASRGRLRVAIVTGEAGVGKTALLRQLEPEVRLRGGWLASGECRDAAVREPYGPWVELLEKLRELVPAGDRSWHELPRLVPALQAQASAPSRGGSQYRLAEELSEFIRRAAQHMPLVLVLDAMQWADIGSWEALEHVAGQLADAPVLLCLVLRSEALDPDLQERIEQFRRVSGAQDVALSRLTRDEVKRWLEAALHRQDVGREFLAFLYRHTEGNPLFIGQLLRTLSDERVLWHSGERWEWQPVSALRLPLGIEALVGYRFARLAPAQQQVLAAAAVVGRAVDTALLVQAADTTPELVREVLVSGTDAGFLGRPAQGNAGRVELAHQLIAESIRRTLDVATSRRLHERAARALEHSAGSAREIALHFDRAGRAAEAYGFALRASAEAEGLYAHAIASELLRLAARDAETPEQLAEVRVRLASLAEVAGRYEEAEELCDLAIEWFTAQGDRARSVTLRRVREQVRNQLGQPARRTLDAALVLDREATALGLDGERVAILSMMSQIHQRLGEPQAAERVATEGVRMAERIGDPALLADALNRLANTIYREQPDRAVETFRRALFLYEEAGDHRGQARCHNNIGNTLEVLARVEEAREALSMALSLARTAGIPDTQGLAALNLGVSWMKSGEYHRSRELFGEALSLFASVKNSEMQLYALYNLAHLDRAEEQYASAAELYETAASLAERVGQTDVELGALGGAGLSRLQIGDRDEAERILAGLEERMLPHSHWFSGRELIEALRVQLALARGRRDEAVACFDAALQLADAPETYGAAWLIAECAELVYPDETSRRQALVARYLDRVESLGYRAIARRFGEIAGRQITAESSAYLRDRNA